jgi:trehalose 6-phosphate phosphatase
MRTLREGVDLREFFERVSRASDRALGLDYDGTLAPFRVQRSQATPFPEAWALLNRIARSGRSRVALVSGRPLRNLESLVGSPEGIELWGSHGAERLRHDGSCEAAPVPPAASHFLGEAEAWLTERGWGPFVERKPYGVAVHGRGESPADFAVVRALVIEGLEDRARQSGCELLPFDGGVEILPRNHQKGRVIETLAEEFGGRAVMAYLGDDASDEDAFRAIRPYGLAGLVRQHPRPTGADFWIRPPGELLWFLEEWEKAERGAEEAALR